jgi:hypothetical protein
MIEKKLRKENRLGTVILIRMPLATATRLSVMFFKLVEIPVLHATRPIKLLKCSKV